MQQAIKKTLNSIKLTLPIMLGILMLLSLMEPLFRNYYPKLFTGNYLIDPIIGAIAGSFAFGIPITSYITGGELLKQGVSLLAVSSFILAWTTVGIAMLALEAVSLGKKFAIYRNLFNFLSSIIIAILTIATLNLIK